MEGRQPGEQTRDWAAKQEILRVLSFIKRRSPGRERGGEGRREVEVSRQKYQNYRTPVGK